MNINAGLGQFLRPAFSKKLIMKLLNVFLIYTFISLLNCKTMSTETLQLKKDEIHLIYLENRGSTGLQLLSRIENESIVSVRRISDPSDTTSSTNLGDSKKATFEIKGLNLGETKITFYETRTWEKDFKEIFVKEIMVDVK